MHSVLSSSGILLLLPVPTTTECVCLWDSPQNYGTGYFVRSEVFGNQLGPRKQRILHDVVVESGVKCVDSCATLS